MSQTFVMIVDLDERGEFSAHVENDRGETVFEISDDPTGADSLEWMIDAGYMSHKTDTGGLLEYMIEMGIVPENSSLRLEE